MFNEHVLCEMHPHIRGRLSRPGVKGFDSMIAKCWEIKSLWRRHAALQPLPSSALPAAHTQNDTGALPKQRPHTATAASTSTQPNRLVALNTGPIHIHENIVFRTQTDNAARRRHLLHQPNMTNFKVSIFRHSHRISHSVQIHHT